MWISKLWFLYMVANYWKTFASRDTIEYKGYCCGRYRWTMMSIRRVVLLLIFHTASSQNVVFMQQNDNRISEKTYFFRLYRFKGSTVKHGEICFDNTDIKRIMMITSYKKTRTLIKMSKDISIRLINGCLFWFM